MAGDGPPRALVVDDSKFMRTVIGDILSSGGVDVVGEARNGEEAVELVARRGPDVVTMDVEMPVMDGVAAVEEIMASTPTPILMLSAHTEANADVTFEALEKGAVDFFTKPGGEVSVEMSGFEEQLVDKVHSVARSEVTAADSRTDRLSRDRRRGEPVDACRDRPTLLIGASTGGPNVVERVVSALPVEAGFRVLVVQHMPPEFTSRYAERLDERTAYDFREADDGDRLRDGQGAVAPGGRHLTVERYRRGSVHLGLSSAPPRHGVRPAIDVTMETAARAIDDPLVGVLLTGMGEDGAEGVRALAAAGGDVIVQDEATSAVFGMPQRAIETGEVDEVLPDRDIPGAVLSAVAGPRTEARGSGQ